MMCMLCWTQCLQHERRLATGWVVVSVWPCLVVEATSETVYSLSTAWNSTGCEFYGKLWQKLSVNIWYGVALLLVCWLVEKEP